MVPEAKRTISRISQIQFLYLGHRRPVLRHWTIRTEPSIWIILPLERGQARELSLRVPGLWAFIAASVVGVGSQTLEARDPSELVSAMSGEIVHLVIKVGVGIESLDVP